VVAVQGGVKGVHGEKSLARRGGLRGECGVGLADSDILLGCREGTAWWGGERSLFPSETVCRQVHVPVCA
jgi:hypothetical protein